MLDGAQDPVRDARSGEVLSVGDAGICAPDACRYTYRQLNLDPGPCRTARRGLWRSGGVERRWPRRTRDTRILRSYSCTAVPRILTCDPVERCRRWKPEGVRREFASVTAGPFRFRLPGRDESCVASPCKLKAVCCIGILSHSCAVVYGFNVIICKACCTAAVKNNDNATDLRYTSRALGCNRIVN